MILALDLYLRHRDRLPDRDDSKIVELSQVLRQLGSSIRGMAENYRNPSSVCMKLNNFRALDPHYTAQGRKGLTRGGKGDALVWQEFTEDAEKLQLVAAAIRANLGPTELTNKYVASEAEDDSVEAPEGRLLTRIHRERERSRKLVELKRKQVLRSKGQLQCEACRFDFEEVYGERGLGFMECHHIRPLRELQPGEQTRLDDLSLLCANCHRMIHARSPWLTIDELRKIVAANRASRSN